MKNILQACSKNSNTLEAVKEVAKKLNGKNAKLNLIFVSRSHNLNVFEDGVSKYFNNNVIASKTAGEITENGYSENSIVGISFFSNDFEFDIHSFTDLDKISNHEIQDLMLRIHNTEKTRKSLGSNAHTIGLLIMDGLSKKEEFISEIVGNSLGEIDLIGGSSGDGLEFQNAEIYYNGKFRKNIALVILLTTSIPFVTFKIQHFESSENKMVVTASDQETRVVKEINGISAAESYAKLIGVELEELDANVFSQYPLALNISGSPHIRSIQRALPDGSLQFFCAIEDGLVLSIANRANIVESTKKQILKTIENLKSPSGAILFECILRKIEVDNLNANEKSELFNIYKKINAVGFHTYGEQYRCVHINQTLTGVIFGS